MTTTPAASITPNAIPAFFPPLIPPSSPPEDSTPSALMLLWFKSLTSAGAGAGAGEGAGGEGDGELLRSDGGGAGGDEIDEISGA